MYSDKLKSYSKLKQWNFGIAWIGICVSIPSVSETLQASYVYLVYFEMSLAIFPTTLELGGLFGLFVISEDVGH